MGRMGALEGGGPEHSGYARRKDVRSGGEPVLGGDSGTGALTITGSSPESGIEYDLLFDGGRYECKSSMKYSRLPDGDTKVTWAMSGDMGRSLTGGYFALLMDSMAGSMFEKGLSNLKSRVEGGS